MPPFRRAAVLFVLVAAFSWLYAGVFAGLAKDWDPDQDRAHGIFIIPISLYLAWRRRSDLRQAPVIPSPVLGGALLALSLGVLTVGNVASQFLARLSILSTVAAVVLVLFGRSHLRLLAFPVGFLALMIPPPGLLYNVPVFKMQLVASQVAEAIVMLTGTPVLREGNMMVLPGATLQVVAACSGVRSLMTLVAIAVLYGHLTGARVWVRLALVATTVPIVVLVNGLRVGGTAVLMDRAGAAAAGGFFHFFSGMIVFLMTLVILAVVHDVLDRTARSRRNPAAAA